MGLGKLSTFIIAIFIASTALADRNVAIMIGGGCEQNDIENQFRPEFNSGDAVFEYAGWETQTLYPGTPTGTRHDLDQPPDGPPTMNEFLGRLDSLISDAQAAGAEGANAQALANRPGQLLIRFMTHGNPPLDSSGHTICLQGEDGQMETVELTDSRIRSRLTALRDHSVGMAFTDESCYGGNSIAALAEFGCTMSDQSPHMVSWNSPAAVTRGLGISAVFEELLSMDADDVRGLDLPSGGESGDGRISMDEAFAANMLGARMGGTPSFTHRQPMMSGEDSVLAVSGTALRYRDLAEADVPAALGISGSNSPFSERSHNYLRVHNGCGDRDFQVWGDSITEFASDIDEIISAMPQEWLQTMRSRYATTFDVDSNWPEGDLGALLSARLSEMAALRAEHTVLANRLQTEWTEYSNTDDYQHLFSQEMNVPLTAESLGVTEEVFEVFMRTTGQNLDAENPQFLYYAFGQADPRNGQEVRAFFESYRNQISRNLAISAAGCDYVARTCPEGLEYSQVKEMAGSQIQNFKDQLSPLFSNLPGAVSTAYSNNDIIPADEREEITARLDNRRTVVDRIRSMSAASSAVEISFRTKQREMASYLSQARFYQFLNSRRNSGSRNTNCSNFNLRPSSEAGS